MRLYEKYQFTVWLDNFDGKLKAEIYFNGEKFECEANAETIGQIITKILRERSKI